MIVHLLLFSALFTLIETPQELMRVGREKQAIEVLANLRNVVSDDVVEEANMVKKEVEDEMASSKLNIFETLRHLGTSGFIKLGTVLMVLSMTHLSGCTVITTYVVDIFSSSAVSEIVLVIVTGLSEMGFSFFQMLIADMLGR